MHGVDRYAIGPEHIGPEFGQHKLHALGLRIGANAVVGAIRPVEVFGVEALGVEPAGGHPHHPAGRRFGKRRRQAAGEQMRARHVGGKGLFEALGGQGAFVGQDPGVMDEAIDRVLGQFVADLGDMLEVGDIEAHHRDARVARLGADGFRGGFTAQGAAAEQHDFRPEVRQGQGRLVTNARVGPGDEVAPAVQVDIAIRRVEGEFVHPVAGAIEGKNNGRIDEPAGRFTHRLPRQRSRGGRIDGGGVGLEGVEEIVDGRVVAGMLGDVGEGEPTAGLDHKGAAELPRVALDTGLSAARSPRPPGRTGQPR